MLGLLCFVCLSYSRSDFEISSIHQPEHPMPCTKTASSSSPIDHILYFEVCKCSPVHDHKVDPPRTPAPEADALSIRPTGQYRLGRPRPAKAARCIPTRVQVRFAGQSSHSARSSRHAPTVTHTQTPLSCSLSLSLPLSSSLFLPSFSSVSSGPVSLKCGIQLEGGGPPLPGKCCNGFGHLSVPNVTWLFSPVV